MRTSKEFGKMSTTDWYITGAGGQGIVNESGSKRCRLSGSKQMLWNGRDNLVNSEIIALVLMGVDTNTRGGLLLRSDLSGNNCYRLRIFGTRTYYIQKVVNGIVTTLATAYSTQPYNIYVKTRFRIDGWQLSAEEWIGGEWVQVIVIIDNEQSMTTGYTGVYGESVNTSYYITFDDVAISESV
jgi:hypothetical protein